MVKFKDTDFLHASSRIKSMEKRLIDGRGLVRMVEATTLEEAYKIVKDAGIGIGTAPEDYERALVQNLHETYDTLSGLCGEHDFVSLLRYEYDALNLKVLIKSHALEKDPEEMLSELGTVPVSELREELRQNKFSLVPPLLAKAAEEAADVLARTGDPQLVDIIVDKGMLAAMLDKASQYKIGFLHRLIKARIDIANLRSLVRIKRIDKELDFLKRVAVPGGNIEIASFAEAFTKGMDGIAALVEGSDYSRILEPALAGLLAGTGLTEFERLCDNCLNRLLDDTRLIPFGPEVIVVYAAAKETEIRAVRIVMASRIAGVAPQIIKERLRETYA